MGLRAILGLDLAGKLKGLTLRYKGNVHEFDHRRVLCTVSEGRHGQSYASACAFCSDPSATGFDVRPIAWFYMSPIFKSRVEAAAHLEAQIHRATKRHPETKFFRQRAAEGGAVILEYCQNGIWYRAEALPTFRNCQGCGREVAGDMCTHCGEPCAW